MSSKQSDYIILTDTDGLHVRQEMEDGLWYCMALMLRSFFLKNCTRFFRIKSIGQTVPANGVQADGQQRGCREHLTGVQARPKPVCRGQ